MVKLNKNDSIGIDNPVSLSMLINYPSELITIDLKQGNSP